VLDFNWLKQDKSPNWDIVGYPNDLQVTMWLKLTLNKMIGLLLFLVQITSICVYLDLWLVIKKKSHLFEPFLGLISQKQRKVYQTIYRKSLIRT
jgi:hypothetical protein